MELHTKQAVSRALKISRPTLDRRIKAGELAVIRLSARAVRIADDELRRYLAARTERNSEPHNP